ncbi:MAG: ABC transporter permease [Armatimonadetes bacterium]|nr:ABC transporter permease [Armatimonadota bacterium]
MTSSSHSSSTAPDSHRNGASPRHQNAQYQTLPPLSPLTYYRRNVWRVLPVGGAIMISVFLIASIVTLLNSVDDSIRVHYGSLSHFSVLSPQWTRDVPPPVLERALKFPEKKQVLVAVPYFTSIKTVFGPMPVPIYGLDQKDMKSFAGATKNTLAPGGRLPRLNEPEIAMSRAWVNNYHLKIGDKLVPENDRLPPLPEQLTLVGIFENGENIGIADKAYMQLSLNEMMQRPTYIFLPKSPQQLSPLSQKLRDITDKPQKYGFTKSDVRDLRVFTFSGLVGELRKGLAFLYRFLSFADALVIGAVALLSGFLANIYFEQRLGEFGLLSALGFRRERLAKRLMTETGFLVLFSWLAGLALTALMFQALDHFYMIPNGLVLAKIGRDALLYTLPTPLLVGVASLATVLFRLYRLDPIEIMERR